MSQWWLNEVEVTSLPAHGALEVIPSIREGDVSMLFDINGQTVRGSLVYIPETDYFGVDHFSWTDGDAKDLFTPATTTLNVQNPNTTVTLNLPDTLTVDGKNPVSLTAHVDSLDSSTPLTGYVEFVDLNVNDYASSLYHENHYLMPTTAKWLGTTPVRSLGVVPINSNNDAVLSLSMLMPGDRDIVAVYYSSSTPLVNRTTGHDYEVTRVDDAPELILKSSSIFSQTSQNTSIYDIYNSQTSPNLSSRSEDSILHVKLQIGCDVLTRTGTFTNPSPMGFQLTNLAGKFGTTPILPDNQGATLSATATLGLTVNYASAPNEDSLSGSSHITSGSSALAHNNHKPSPVPDPSPMPTGTLSLYDGDTLLKTFVVDNTWSGVYVPDSGSLALGTHTFRFVYDGDSLYAGFTVEKSVEISNTSTKTTISGLENAVCQNSTVNIKAVVANSVLDIVAPTGTVQYLLNGSEIAVVTLGESQNASISLPVGSYTLRALYSGDATHMASETSTSFYVTYPAPEPVVTATPTKTSTKLKVTSKISGKKLIVSAKLLNASTGQALSGTIQWLLDGKLIGTSKSGKSLTLSPKLTKGNHTLVAKFAKTKTYAQASKSVGLKEKKGS